MFKMNKFCDQKTLIGIIAIIDMVFGAIYFGLYLRKLMFFYVFDYDNITEREFNPSSLRLLALFPMILNGFQVLVAYHLLMSTKSIDPFRSLAKATMWFQSAIVILTFLGLKLFLLLLFPSNTMGDSNLPLTFVIWETLFKVGALYIVRGYMNQLKMDLYPPPDVQFYSVYVPPSANVNLTSSSSSPLPSPLSSPSPINNALNFPNYMTRPSSRNETNSNPVVYV